MENISRMSNSELVMELGQQFKEYRLQYRLTQQEAAERAGMSVITLRQFENGKAYNITMTNFFALMRVVHQIGNVKELLPEIPISLYLLDKIESQKPKRIRHEKQD